MQKHAAFVLGRPLESNYTCYMFISSTIPPSVSRIAVKQTWRALSFASATLRRDATVVRCALVQDVAAMELAAEELKRDLNFARSDLV